MGVAETRRAIDFANQALPAWRAKTAKERAKILRKWFDLIMQNQEPLAQLMTAEQGKPLEESRGEIAYGASFIEWFGEEAKRLYGETIPGHATDKRLIVIKQAIGVCAAITPWNFPSAMITRKAGPALAAGCTIVLKPASQTPFSALALCKLAEEAGIPPGVFSCVTGSATAIGGELSSNPIVKKLSFTWSWVVMHHSSSLMTLILRQQSKGQLFLNIETLAKLVFVQIASWCKIRYMTCLLKNLPKQ